MPPRRQEQLQDAGIAVALSAVNAVSLLPYRAQLHPFWLALLLVIAQGVPLAWRRARPVGIGLIIGVARVAYDRIGFGFAPFPLGPAIAVYTVVDRRGRIWRWVVAALIVVGMTLSLTQPRAQRAVRGDLPGSDLPYRLDRGPRQPVQAAPPGGRAEPG